MGDSSTKIPLMEDSFTDVLSAGFSKFLKDNHREYRRLKSANPEEKKYRALCSEYDILDQAFNPKELDDEVYCSCLTEKNLSFLIIILYLSNLFNVDKDDMCKFSLEFRKRERLRLLVTNANVSKEELQLIARLVSKITNPHRKKSHMDSIKICIQYANEWLNGNDLSMAFGTSISYAMLKRSVKEIVGSAFFNSLPPPPLEKDNPYVAYVEVTLEDWLKANQNNILQEITVTYENACTKAFRLSPDVRRILWGVLRKLRELHKESCKCQSLTNRKIYIGSALEVEFRQMKVARGDYLLDFQKLKLVIKDILKQASPSVDDESRYPLDLKHYMEIIDEENEKNRELLYNHPFVWSSCDVIKNIYLYAAIYESSTKAIRTEMSACMVKLPSQFRGDWRHKVLRPSPYDVFLAGWSYYRKAKSCWEALFYMRDVFAHVHQYVSEGKQCLYKTENEVFAMFPLYMANFVKEISGIEAFRCVLSTT